MARAKAAKDFYIDKGLQTRKTDKREDTAAGRLAAFIIGKIPENFDIYEDHDINEAHFAQAVVENCGRWIRYCPQIGWLVYKEEDGRWTERYAESAVQKVVTHFGELLWEGASEANGGEMAFSRRILSSAGISAIKNILKHDPKIACEQEGFDADGDWLNCAGDAYNLRTEETRPAEPEDLFMKSTSCKAAPLRKIKEGGWALPKIPKMFEDFMTKITSKDGEKRPDLAFYILSWFGYCLTGDNGASFFVNFHGEGANGKSELLSLMLELFGDYAKPIPQDVVIENRFQSQFDYAGLPGIRMGLLIDAPEGRLNMDKLKSIISGEAINAKRKYLKDIDFKPVCKIAVGSNYKLKLKDTGLGIRRRVRMVPFDYTVPDKEKITYIHKKILKEEAPEILALLIYLAHEYYRKGEGPKAFPLCDVVDKASEEYIKSEDFVGRWKEERTEACPGNTESVADLYEDFKKWAEGEGTRKVMGKNSFGDHLQAGLKKKRVGDTVHYMDIKLKYRQESLPGAGGG